MFEHLDDPTGFDPGPGFRQGVIHRATRRRRRRRLLSASAASAVVVLAVGSGALIFLNHRMDSINRVDVRTALTPDEPPGPTPAQSRPFTVLLVGTDGGQPLAGGTAPSDARADTMMLIRVDPGQHRLTTLPLPRDLYLPIAGTGRSDRLNTAIAGGPSRLIATIHQQLGVAVQHYIQVDFHGAVQIIDAVGGVRLRFDTPVRDLSTGFHVDRPGCTRLDGNAGLAFGRSRHYEVFVGGRWAADSTGDLGRLERARIVGNAMVDAFRHLTASNPVTVIRIVNALADNATIDSGLSNGDLVRLAPQLRPASGQSLRLPLHSAFVQGREGGQDVLELSDGAASVIQAFEAGKTDDDSAVQPSGPSGVTNPPPCE